MAAINPSDLLSVPNQFCQFADMPQFPTFPVMLSLWEGNTIMANVTSHKWQGALWTAGVYHWFTNFIKIPYFTQMHCHWQIPVMTQIMTKPKQHKTKPLCNDWNIKSTPLTERCRHCAHNEGKARFNVHGTSPGEDDNEDYYECSERTTDVHVTMLITSRLKLFHRPKSRTDEKRHILIYYIVTRLLNHKIGWVP